MDNMDYAYNEETFLEKAALERVLTARRKRINRLNTLRVSLIWKVKSVKTVNIDEINVFSIQ